MRQLRRTGVLTGLPDSYARGRIIGDYRRVALYGTDRLIADKMRDKDGLTGPMNDELIRIREEVSEQIIALRRVTGATAAAGFVFVRVSFFLAGECGLRAVGGCSR